MRISDWSSDVCSSDLFGLNTNLYETDQRVVDTVDWRATAGGTLRTRTFGRTRTIGAFVEDAIHLGPETLLTLGARQDWWRAYDGGLTGRAGAGYATRFYAARAHSAFIPKLPLRHAFAGDWVAELSQIGRAACRESACQYS